MKALATISNGAWLAASLPESHRFKAATQSIETAQRGRLRAILSNYSGSALANAWKLGGITEWERFAQNISVTNYDDYAPWIDRIRQGESDVLTRGTVRCLEPTSGSGGGKKLVPYNRALRSEFRRAVAAWIVPLFKGHPDLMNGRAYWSVTPQIQGEHNDETAVPTGFASDTDYLGGVISLLSGRIMAVPPEVAKITDMPTFWHATLLSLLNCRDLRLMSVWHPSFITLLLANMRNEWEQLLRDLHDGCVIGPDSLRFRAGVARMRELEALGPSRPGRIWPRLGLISCWGGPDTMPYLGKIRSEFPNALIQPKGLVATEAAITIPIGALKPLAVRSHFFEFRDDDGEILPAWNLNEGCEYTVIVTTSGGLLRYDLGDRVRVDGFLGQVPSLEFMGRAGNLSDHFGEKLEAFFVSRVVNDAIGTCEVKAGFTLMALELENDPHYSLFIESETPLPDNLAGLVDRKLRENVHYDLCRRLGQLGPVDALPLDSGAFEHFTGRLTGRGTRLGDIKPTILSSLWGWRKHLPILEKTRP